MHLSDAYGESTCDPNSLNRHLQRRIEDVSERGLYPTAPRYTGTRKLCLHICIAQHKNADWWKTLKDDMAVVMRRPRPNIIESWSCLLEVASSVSLIFLWWSALIGNLKNYNSKSINIVTYCSNTCSLIWKTLESRF